MKIAMIASEAAPFVKTGGLGDVLQALPDELARVEGNEVALFLPYYKTIKQNPEIETELLSAFTVNLTWRQQYVGLFRSSAGGRTCRSTSWTTSTTSSATGSTASMTTASASPTSARPSWPRCASSTSAPT